ncbi:hypothetical protein [Gordonia neofelifaecis]|uniref:Uncharacterized protein n=1 Tax=Gordonia neofelifaecis NRRL B-59395 TaxID=644548 RepID=F1YG32_9ACTN|nr:hypothetical protein [Gordonia neofelifaecis]EGD56155.1 hypothetical protein SCNU_04836 [Gordonia neofelifaecis NRRL B-59395]
MIAILTLLVLAVVAAAGASLVRGRLVDDPDRTDAAVLRADALAAAVSVVLLASAALVAATTDPMSGAALVAVQIAAVIAAATTGSSAVRIVLALGGIPTRADNHDDEPDAPLRGGRVIGVLERTAVAVSLLLAWPAGLGIILAVKSLARFSELRAPHASEQFILGTFASVLWAASFAGVGWLAGM